MTIIPSQAMTLRSKLPLIALLSCLPLAACSDRASIEKAKALEIELEQHGQLLSRARQDLHRLESKIDASERENKKLKEDNAKLEEERDAQGKEVEKIRKDFENYKVQYKLSMKKRAPGLHVEDFIVDGMAYRNVILKELTDSQLTFVHDAGVQKMSLALLPGELRDLLGLNIVMPVNVSVAKPGTKQAMAQIEANNLRAVASADQRLGAVLKELAETRDKYYHEMGVLSSNKANHLSLTGVQKNIADLTTKIAKLEGQLAEANLNSYQARQEQLKKLPVR